MEGQSKPETDSQVSDPEQSDQTPPQKKSLKDRFKKTPLPLKIGAAAGAAVLATIAAVKGAQEISQGDSTKPDNPTATETIAPTPIPSQVVEITPTLPQEVTVYSQIKDKIERQQIPQEKKTQLIQTVENLQNTSAVLAQFENAYLSHKETDGTPTLLKIEKDRFNNVDFSASTTPREQLIQDHLEKQVFFLKDISEIKQFEQKIANIQSFDEIAGILTEYQQNYSTHFTLDYSHTEFGAQKEKQLTIDDSQIPPEKKADSDKVKAQIEAIVAKIPPLGNINYRIVDTTGGNFFYTQNTIQVGLEGIFQQGEYGAHETGHYLDISLNSYIRPKLTPEQIVDAYILRAQILENTTQNLDLDQVISPTKKTVFDKVQRGEKITPQEADIYASIPTHFRFMSDNQTFYQDINYSAIMDKYIGASSWDNYQNVSEFIEKEAQNLDDLSAQNPEIAKIIADMRARPGFYDNFWESITPKDSKETPKSQKAYWGMIQNIVNLAYYQDILSGNIRLAPEKIKSFFALDYHQPGIDTSSKLAIDYAMGVEVFGEALGNHLTIRDLITDPNQTLEGQYLNSLNP